MPTTLPSPSALNPPQVGMSSVQIAAVNPQRTGLYVFNPSGTVTLWVSPDGTPAAVNGAGSVAIQPLQGIFFGPPTMPSFTQAMNCISTATNSNVTVWEYYT
jgi:hypothetical protein